ncbi:MAG: response regulator transcription factor [Pirellulales bacterium]|nr:response regulator transcription factor [Pirellulales bacterium]
MRESLVALACAMNYAARGFESARAFYDVYQPEMPGCLLLDIQMPGQTGLELYEQLIREGKRIPVIFITAHADVSMAVAAMKTGAIEFLEKPFERHALRQLLEAAFARDAEWRRREAEYRQLDERIARLTERDRETLELLLAGIPNKAMAARLLISERAVEMRRAAIMRKLQVRSLAELLELAITHRILGDIAGAAQEARLR